MQPTQGVQKIRGQILHTLPFDEFWSDLGLAVVVNKVHRDTNVVIVDCTLGSVLGAVFGVATRRGRLEESPMLLKGVNSFRIPSERSPLVRINYFCRCCWT